MKEKCKHRRVRRGLKLGSNTDEYYCNFSYCPGCNKKWFDNGQRWKKSLLELKREHKFGTKELTSLVFPIGKWVRINFTKQKSNHDLPLNLEFPGTYAIYHGTPFNSKYHSLYVGQSINVRNRLKSHLSFDWKTRKYFVKINGSNNKINKTSTWFKIAVRKEKRRHERLMVEERVIDMLKPEWNKGG